ncbi:hypothetical protein [Pandoraea anhela]|uniref:Uncharacterized protein n=1 Tax=Pandoraea anhela TaxID=2508295 RepID=A0A5E4S5E2_9BURK|nr:hypothetical protein [Pandoraea anhela]VVD70857.1 hypothetical protein PAN31108_00619 [Pandoraea anhela]
MFDLKNFDFQDLLPARAQFAPQLLAMVDGELCASAAMILLLCGDAIAGEIECTQEGIARAHEYVNTFLSVAGEDGFPLIPALAEVLVNDPTGEKAVGLALAAQTFLVPDRIREIFRKFDAIGIPTH